MKLFNIFSRSKTMTLKELYAPVLDQMWVCVVNFCPWKNNGISCPNGIVNNLKEGSEG